MLWCALTFFWLLLLPQWVADRRPDQNVNWAGAIFWSVVLLALLVAVVRTIQRYRAQ